MRKDAAHDDTQRLTSFTDGVIAIIITIMVLALPVPNAPGMAALQPLSVLFAAYALSFVKVGIYWSQHHNVVQAARKVNGQVLLANLFFLFWLSLIPFVVRWVGEAGVTRDTVLAFGVIMLLTSLSFALLLYALLRANDADAPIAKAARRGAQGAGHDPRLRPRDRGRLPVAAGRRGNLHRRRRDVADPRQEVRSADRLTAVLPWRSTPTELRAWGDLQPCH